jgi:hypothetical protein
MSAGWSWSILPQRLMGCDAFFELSHETRMVLLMLYMRCDRWGRGPVGARSLGVLIGVLDVPLVRRAVAELEGSAFLTIHDDAWWQLAHYDEDLPKEVIRKRGVSQYGSASPPVRPKGAPPPPEVGQGSAPVPPVGRQTPDEGRSHDDATTDAGPHHDGATTAPEGLPGSVPAPDEVGPFAAPTPPQGRHDAGRMPPEVPPCSGVGPAIAAPRRDRDIDETKTRLVPRGGPEAAGAGADTGAFYLQAPPSLAAPPAVGLDLSAETGPIARPRAFWPEGCEDIGLSWYKRLNERRQNGHGYTLDDVKRVAMEFPDDFALAAAEMCEGEKGWSGRNDIIAWLRRQCVFAGERRADQERKRRENAPGRRYSPSFRQAHEGEGPPPRGPEFAFPLPDPAPLARPPRDLGVLASDPAWESAWSTAMDQLRRVVEPWDVETWLVPCRPAGRTTSGEPVLACPDDAHCEWVEDHFAQFLTGALGTAPRLSTYAAAGMQQGAT